MTQLFGPQASNPRIQFGLSFWTIADFNALTDNCQTVSCYAHAIQKYLLPHNIYWVPIYQYGDANTSATCQGSMCLQSDVNNLLTAGDEFGMHFLFWFPTWGFDGGGESNGCNIPVSQSGNSWQTEVLNYWAAKLDVPQTSLAEVNSAGGTVCVLRQDYVSLWTQQMERDIFEIHTTYGSHPSFAGFLQYWEFSVGYGAYDNTGYSAQTQANYSRSQFYSSGCLQCYLQYEFQQVLNNAAVYCQTLMPSCIIMSDEAPSTSPDVANYYGYSLTGAQSPNSWPSTYGADDEGTICSATFNCGIGRGFATNSFPVDYPNYVAGEAIAFRCFPGTPPAYSCNNGNYNTVQAIPYELTGSYPNQITPLVWIQTSAASLVSNFTNDAQGDIPPNVGATTGQDFLYNERYFAYVASNTVYPGRELGFSSSPLANILLVNSDPADGNSHAAANFLTQEFLQSVGFNVTAVDVSQVKDLNLLKFNAILWTSLDQPNQTNETTYDDIVNAVNSGVGFILVGNAGSGYGGGTGVPSTTLNNLFGLTYPVVGCCSIPNDPAPISGMVSSTASSAAKLLFSPYGSLTMSDFVPNMSPPEAYLYNTTSTFASNGGIVLATATDTNNGGSFPVMVAMNGTGSGHGRMLWLGTTYDTSGLYGSYVSSGLYTKQLDVYINMLLYASKKDSIIPFVYTSSSQPPYYPGITFSMLGTKSGSDLVWFSDYTAPGTPGGAYTESIDYTFSAPGMGISGSWIALNLANMQVVNEGSSDSISLPLNMQNETWAPVYVTDLTPSSLGLVYDNSVLNSHTMGASSATYTLSSPPDSGSWLVVQDSAPPSSVAAGGSSITQYSSLSGLVSATENAFMQTNPSNWTPTSGWYFDPSHQLLYIAYVGGQDVQVAITQPASTTTSTTSSSTSVATSTTTSASSTPFDFALTVAPSSGSLSQGGTVSATVSVSLISGRPEPISFTASQLPPGVSVSFAPQSSDPGSTSTMTVSASSATPVGTYTIVVTGAAGGLTKAAEYILSVSKPPPTMYDLTVTAQPSQGGTTALAPGSYVYPSGSLLTIDALPASGWSLESWYVNGAPAGNGTSFTLDVNGNTTVVAKFVQRPPPTGTVTVSVYANAPGASVEIDGVHYALPASFDWQPGSNHTISALPVLETGPGARAVFDGWPGSGGANSTSLTVTAARRLTVPLDYTSQYLVTLRFVDANSRPLSPSDVLVQGPGFSGSAPPGMTMWLNAGATYTVTQAKWMQENALTLQSIQVTHPGEYTVPMAVYSVTIRVADIYGMPVEGATVTLAPWSGLVLVKTTGANGSVTFAQVPLGTYTGTVSFLGLTSAIASSSVGNVNTTVTLVFSYPVLASAGIFAALAAIMAYRRKKRQTDGDAFVDPVLQPA